MNKKIKRITAAFASLAVAASTYAGIGTQLAANAAYGNGGNGAAIMEYLDRGVYAIKSGDGMFVSWRFNANDADDAEFQLSVMTNSSTPARQALLQITGTLREIPTQSTVLTLLKMAQ